LLAKQCPQADQLSAHSAGSIWRSEKPRPLAENLRNRQRLRFRHRKARANNYWESIVSGYICEANESAIELVLKMPTCALTAIVAAPPEGLRANNGDQISVTASSKKQQTPIPRPRKPPENDE
jgi:hypothetical protein